MWGLRHSLEPNVSWKYGCAFQGESVMGHCVDPFVVLIFSLFIPRWTSHKKKYIFHALQMKHRTWVICSLGVNIIRVAQKQIKNKQTKTNNPWSTRCLEVLYYWWSHRKSKRPTCETKPVCLSLAGLLANRCWIIYRENLPICSVVLQVIVSSLQPTSETATSHAAAGRIVP